MQVRPVFNLWSARLHALPVAVFLITDRCRSRCLACEYWRTGMRETSVDFARHLVRELSAMGTGKVLLSGGEPLEHPQWDLIAEMFRKSGIRVEMATNGLLLYRHADRVAETIDELYVSLDGSTPESYRAIRGIDGLAALAQGIQSLRGRIPVTIRTTVQRENFREIPSLLHLSKSWGVAHHSFLAADAEHPSAFGRTGPVATSLALAEQDLRDFEIVLEQTERDFGPEYDRRFILESRTAMRGLYAYFASRHGKGACPTVRCNAPRFSAVIEADGGVRPCFFLPAVGRMGETGLREILNTPAGIHARRQQSRGDRPECRRCVCPAYRSMKRLWGKE
jgi:MoaA/NifB/PqqE/SkfB family radical SAM enzyme